MGHCDWFYRPRESLKPWLYCRGRDFGDKGLCPPEIEQTGRGAHAQRNGAIGRGVPYVHSTVWTTQRCSQLYREEKKEEGDRGGQEDNGGNQKERDRSSQ